MKIYKEIAYYTSTKEFYEKAENWGERAKKIFNQKTTQMSNLRTIAETTFKVTDILNYIKNQASKSWKNKDWNYNNFARDLIRLLYENENEIICTYKKQITGKPGFKDTLQEWERQQIHLKLCRIFIKQMVVHFNYFKKENKRQKRDKK